MECALVHRIDELEDPAGNQYDARQKQERAFDEAELEEPAHELCSDGCSDGHGKSRHRCDASLNAAAHLEFRYLAHVIHKGVAKLPEGTVGDVEEHGVCCEPRE